MSMDIIAALEDPKLFGGLLKDQSTWATWKVFLRALFALPMKDNDLATYSQFTGRTKPPAARFNEAFAIVGRRGGKSFISAIIACFLALFHDWKPYLSPGEIGWIMVIASDRQQAKVIFRYVQAILDLKIFRAQVSKAITDEIQLKNGIAISVKTCDYRTLRGYTVVAAICDELSFYRSEGANPAAEILTAIRPSLATVPGSLLLGISTPYAKTGPLYEAFRDKYGQDNADTLIWKAGTRDMNPCIKQGVIDKALKEDYSAARAEWLAEFREDLETFLATELIESAVISGRYELPFVSGMNYCAFVDPSSGRQDSFTLGIAHKDKDSGRVILDRIEERKPPFAPLDVIKEYAEVMKRYGVYRVSGDRYAGDFVSRGFEDAGVHYEAAEKDRSGIYLEFEPLLAQGQLELLDNKGLFAQLRGLERQTRSGGRDKVDHYQGGKDDIANSTAGACVLAAAGRNYNFEITVF